MQFVGATDGLVGGTPKLKRSGTFRVDGASYLPLRWTDALGKSQGDVSIGGPSTAFSWAHGGGSDVIGLHGVGGKPSKTEWASWPSFATDAAFLNFPPVPPGTHDDLKQRVKLGLSALDEWSAYFLELAAFEEACNGLLFRAHVANRWDLLDDLYPRIWELLARRNYGTASSPRYRFDQPAAPWPGYPPNLAAARAAALTWKTDESAVDDAIRIVKKRQALGIPTPTWAGFVVPFQPFPWIHGKNLQLDDNASAKVVFAVFIPTPDGLFEIVAKIVIAGAIAGAFATVGGAAAAGVLGESTAADLAVGVLESQLESAGGQAILTGDAGLSLDAALGVGLDQLGGGELADLIGSGPLSQLAQETAGGVAAGQDLDEAALAAFASTKGAGLPVFADLFDTFEDGLDEASQFIKESAALANNLAEIKVAFSSDGGQGKTGGSSLAGAPPPVLGSTIDPNTGQVPFLPVGPLGDTMGLVLFGALLIGGIWITTRNG